MDVLTILGIVARYGPVVARIINAAASNADAVTKIDALPPEVGTTLKNLGKQFFPQAAPDVQVVAGAVAVDLNGVTALQTMLNAKLHAGLKVDGIYGQATKDAVSKFQKDNGLVVDGVAGKNTKAALAKL